MIPSSPLVFPPNAYWHYPMGPQNTTGPDENYGLMTSNNGPGQQRRSTPDTSICVNPAVLQLTATAPPEDWHVKADTLQWVMKEQEEHHQRCQQPRQPTPAPIPSPTVASGPPPILAKGTEPRPLRSQGLSAPLTHRTPRPIQWPSQMIAALRSPGYQRTQRRGGRAGYPSEQAVDRAIFPHGGGPQRVVIAQARNTETNYASNTQSPFKQMPTAPPNGLPRVKEHLHEMFTVKAEQQAIESGKAQGNKSRKWCI